MINFPGNNLNKKKIFKNLILLFSSLLITFLFFEMILRMIIGTSILYHSRLESDFIEQDSLVHYLYKKNIKRTIVTKDYSSVIKINSYGYRDRPWDFSKKNKNILVLGDSFTAGFGVEENKRWSGYLQKLLDHNDSTYKIYNAAVSGYNLEQMKNTSDILFPIITPDIVIIGFNLKALDRLEDPYIYFSGFSLRKSKIKNAVVCGDELYIYKSRIKILQNAEYLFLKYSVFYNYIIKKMDVLLKKINQKNMDNELLHKHFKILLNMKEGLQEGTNMFILPVIQHTNDMVFEESIIDFYNKTKIFCRKNNIGFINILEPLNKELERGRSLWINTDTHWNENTHEIVAKTIDKEIFN